MLGRETLLKVAFPWRQPSTGLGCAFRDVGNQILGEFSLKCLFPFLLSLSRQFCHGCSAKSNWTRWHIWLNSTNSPTMVGNIIYHVISACTLGFSHHFHLSNATQVSMQNQLFVPLPHAYRISCDDRLINPDWNLHFVVWRVEEAWITHWNITPACKCVCLSIIAPLRYS